MSQFNIDQFVAKFYNGYQGVFLETGSSHPTDQNNTYNLEKIGWSGMLVEPRTDHNEDYKKLRPNSIVENYALVGKDYPDKFIKAYKHEYEHMYNITGIHEHNTEEHTHWTVSTLDSLLKKHNMRTIDFFSLDVEGYEHEVLSGIDFNYVKFGLILIEWHDYSWNNKTNDFSYLKEHGYSYLTMLSDHHELWVNDICPVNTRPKYKSNL
jgi:FkbM family methyltransferase